MLVIGGGKISVFGTEYRGSSSFGHLNVLWVLNSGYNIIYFGNIGDCFK